VEAPREIASADVDLRASDGLVNLALPVPIGAPPGLYQVQLGRADGQGRRWTLEPLRVLPGAPSAAVAPLASFGGELALERIGLTGDASAGRPSFELGWRALKQPRGDWRFSARLVDDAGHLWGSSDGRPADGFFPTRLWAPNVPVTERRDVAPRAGTPPGRYRLEVRVYGLDGTGLDVVDARGAAVAPFYRPEPFELGPGPAPAQPPVGAPPLDLLEVRLGAERAAAGTTIPLAALLRANTPPGRDLALSVKIGPTEQRLPLAAGFPASRWRPGEVVAAQVDPRVPFELPAGTHDVMLTIVDTAGSPVLGPLPAGRLTVENRPRRFDAPPIGRAIGARLGDAIELLGYDLAASGERASLTIYWRAAGPIETSYTVFTHLLDSEGRVKGQVDAVPGGGALPTDGWAPGEVVTDRYEIPLQAGASSGRYTVEVGMYDARSGARLPVRAGGGAQSAGSDFLILGAVDLAP
jgi:hypothetical protein